MKHTKHYTIADIESAIEDERAKFKIWRYQALRELRACLGQDQSPKRSAARTEWHDDGNKTLQRSRAEPR
jgi:hypothetical protein